MAGLGILIAWAGYSVMYFGITQVQGGRWGFADLVVPSKWTAAVAATPKDSGAPATTSNTTIPSSAINNRAPGLNPTETSPGFV